MNRRQRLAKYDKSPATRLPEGVALQYGPSLWSALRDSSTAKSGLPLLLIDCYPGVDKEDLVQALNHHLPEFRLVDLEESAARSVKEINEMISPLLTDDPVFGRMNNLAVSDFYNLNRRDELKLELTDRDRPTVVVGWGASQLRTGSEVLVLADMPRWEIQLRQRAGAPNWRAGNETASSREKFKRGYFLEWRAADRHKTAMRNQVDFIIDTSRGCHDATMIGYQAYQDALRSLTTRPFRVVPFFDPGVWGGEWMREKFDLDRAAPNFAWCFDCVPEENSIRLSDGARYIEIPAINLVLDYPEELLGERVFKRFGAEFPIRFDMLDTVGGQNLSLQVHPMVEYIKEHFGMNYTQDESYYILDSTESSAVYLGLKNDIDQDAMVEELARATSGKQAFDADKYVNRIPVKKHDHVSIPAGTIHCSAADTMVLEISATPYIFTFKLWDWDRTDLDGNPRPIHLDHGVANIQWNRDADWVRDNLVHRTTGESPLPNQRDEKTGLHQLEFLETRRAWFSESIDLQTDNTVTVMTLVEGDAIEINSPHHRFAPFALRYGETVILPAGIGAYTLNKGPNSSASLFATIRAWVR